MSSKLVGQQATQKRLKALQNTRPLLQTVQLRAVAEAKKRVAVRTGFTRRTIVPGDLTDRFTIVEAAGAARYLEFGTRPHTIRPKSKRVLSWTANGRRFFAKVVHHPGTKKQPFLVPAAVEAIKSVGLQPLVDEWNKAA